LNKTKSFEIPKQLIWDAYLRVKKNQGAAGVDEVSIQEYEKNLKNNLYKLWNRMSSGSYFPPPVRVVLISKQDGGKRSLGIPTVADRIAQTAAALVLEPLIEPNFDPDSYGYRPNKSAIQAVGQARQRCFKNSWVIDLDIKCFFDNIDHQLVMKALEKHTSCRWLRFYVKRWLTVPAQGLDGTLVERHKGTPQGGVISPLLANLMLHYAFDHWMRRNYHSVSFERYADDIIVHCKSQYEAEKLLKAIKERLLVCHLELNQQKTRIVYCGNMNPYKDFPHQSFDFLGFTFRKRLTQSKIGKRFVGFLPAISNRAKQRIRTVIKRLRIHRQIHHTADSLASWLNPLIRGWSNYYGKYYRAELVKPLMQIDIYLIRWVSNKFKKSTGALGIRRAVKYWDEVRRYKSKLFAHWEYGCWRLSSR
jgi:RNA-directed DNA polymerase